MFLDMCCSSKGNVKNVKSALATSRKYFVNASHKFMNCRLSKWVLLFLVLKFFMGFVQCANLKSCLINCASFPQADTPHIPSASEKVRKLVCLDIYALRSHICNCDFLQSVAFEVAALRAEITYLPLYVFMYCSGILIVYRARR